MLNFLTKKLTLSLIFIILIFFYYIVDLNFFKLQSIYFEKKWKYTKKKYFKKIQKFLKSKIMEKFFLKR